MPDMKNKHLIKALEKHRTHQVEPTLEQADSIHYGRLCCITCKHQHLKWLGPNELVLLGVVKEHDIGNLIKQKKKLKENSKAPKNKKLWNNVSHKERDFYKSYQPNSFALPRTPSQLIGDRLAITGISKYNGNSIGSIPIPYLQHLIKTNKINKKEDRALIMANIELRQIGA
jgi:hypothetical protein